MRIREKHGFQRYFRLTMQITYCEWYNLKYPDRSFFQAVTQINSRKSAAVRKKDRIARLFGMCRLAILTGKDPFIKI